jgi:predicted transcriptional regulator
MTLTLIKSQFGHQRTVHGYRSNRDFAARAGINQVTLQRLLTGTEPTGRTIARVLRALPKATFYDLFEVGK